MSEDKIILFDVLEPGESRRLVDGTCIRRSEYGEIYEHLKDGLWTDVTEDQLVFTCSKHAPVLMDDIEENIADLAINTVCFKPPLLNIGIYNDQVTLNEEEVQKVRDVIDKWLTAASNAKKAICRGIY